MHPYYLNVQQLQKNENVITSIGSLSALLLVSSYSLAVKRST